jgi:hypothetical protein
MHNKTFALVILLSGSLSNLYGNNYMESAYQYSQTYKDEELDSISVNGSVVLQNTTIRNCATVNGSLLAIDSCVKSIQVNGSATLKNSLIKAGTVVNGSLRAEESIFEGTISVASEKTVLKNCETNLISIRRIGGSQMIQILELSGNTVVNGDIVFEVSGGEVIITGEAKILGDIIGGTIRSK